MDLNFTVINLCTTFLQSQSLADTIKIFNRNIPLLIIHVYILLCMYFVYNYTISYPSSHAFIHISDKLHYSCQVKRRLEKMVAEIEVLLS